MPYPPPLVIASRNRAKAGEMVEILQGYGVAVSTLADYPEAMAADEPDEVGCTYAENAEIKARAAFELTGRVCVADDAGLEIDALDGQPGVYSRRFLGEETTFPDKMTRLLAMLRDVPEERRGCRFVSVVAIATPDGRVLYCHGVCEGRVAHAMRGQNGFGYDPVFYLPALGRHMAELTPAEKHAISHRGKALACAVPIIRELLGQTGEMGARLP
ncbi:MAG TPA: RdgB/HAM1 family non-canonical purine NTP pyrophosphatase [Chthonomonadales bacterium]|nr:RdgB/HAM1 family non-canonical purine NTP pyrophosphatase [Chthonomonadales bacterium]